DCPEGLQFMARIKIVGVYKETFAHIAQNLGFVQHIRMITHQFQPISTKKLATDTFEAFIACLKQQVNMRVSPGTGHPVVENFVRNILKDFQFSLRFEDLWDPNSRINEANMGNKSLKIKYTYSNEPHHGTMHVRTEILADVKYSDEEREEAAINHQSLPLTVRRIIGTGLGYNKTFSEQKASQEALETLEKLGYA